LQKLKFSDYPIETAMEIFSELMYGGLPEELAKAPFAVTKNFRNEANNGTLGLMSDVEYVMYDIRKKTQTQVENLLLKYVVEDFMNTEKQRRIFQKYGLISIINSLPIINYLGIHNMSESMDKAIAEDMFELEVVESKNVVRIMQFYIQNDTLFAYFSGIKIEKDIIRDVMKAIM
jgi:hypothetical protein